MADKPSHIQRARVLRINMTEAETKLWQYLRNRKFHNLKFLRQHPVIYQIENQKPHYYIADFYCSEKKVIVELDGKIHDFQKEKDEFRDSILVGMGIRILRIKNEDTDDIFIALGRIKEFVFGNG
jgi:leucyl-tRNA synthetase